jgi:hypothetical protein
VNVRALKILVVVMGIAIVAGTATLVVLIVNRMGQSHPVSGAPVIPISAAPLTLDEPDGTHVTGVSLNGDRLAVALRGGGPDRVLILDARSLAVLGRVTLAH